MGCGTQLVKFILFGINFVFVICGVGLIVAGALTHTGYQRYLWVLEEPLGAYQAPPIIMMVVGSIVFIIAFAGCCGAIKESNCLMTTYAILMFVILLVEVAIVVLVVVYRDDFEDFLKKEMGKSMNKYGKDDEVTKSWDFTQKELKCCGVKSFTEWGVIGIPDSCCGDASVISGGCSVANLTLYKQGCLTKIIEDIGVKYIIIAGSIFAAALVVAIIFACCLAARFRRKR